MPDNLFVKWNGTHKIKAVIAMRQVFDLGLREAVAILNSNDGFVISPLQWIALRGEYMLKATSTGVSVDGNSCMDRFINDWLVMPYVQAFPEWLVDKHVREDIVSE